MKLFAKALRFNWIFAKAIWQRIWEIKFVQQSAMAVSSTADLPLQTIMHVSSTNRKVALI